MAVTETAGELIVTKGDQLVRDLQFLNSDGDPIETMAGAMIEVAIRQTDSAETLIWSGSTDTGDIVISDVADATATLTVQAAETDDWPVGEHRYAVRITDGAGYGATVEVGRCLIGQDYITP